MLVRLLFLLAALFSAVGLHAAPAEPQLKTLLQFDPAVGELPESITVDRHGDLYLSMAGSATIVKFRPGLEPTEYAALPVPAGALALGVKVGPDGCLYALSGAFTAEPAAAFLWKICAAGEVEQVAAFDPTGFPNDLAFDRDGRIYVTDPLLGRIWRVDASGASVWLEDDLLAGDPANPALPASHFGVDGIAFDRSGRQLFVGNLDRGEIIAIAIDRAGEPAGLWVHASDPRLVGVDGLALDVAGNLYAAINGQDALAVVNRKGAVEIVAQGEPLDAPSSLVFGNCRDRDTLYITSFAINRAISGQPARPALHSLDTRRPGLPLLPNSKRRAQR